MREQDLKQMVYSIMSHPLFIQEFYKPNGERLLPLVSIPNIAKINAEAGIEETIYKDQRTGREVRKEDLVIKVYPLLIRLLDADELKAVIGHELCHLKYKDYENLAESKKTLAILLNIAVLVAFIFIPWYFCVASYILGSIGIRKKYFNQLQEMEKKADLYGGAVSSPEAMTRALSKLQGVVDQINKQNGSGGDKSFMEHFQVHPSTNKRITHIKDEETACRVALAQ